VSTEAGHDQFASHLAAAGVPARTVMELCRHTSLAVTQRYMHLSPNAMREGIDMLAKSRAKGGRPVVFGEPATGTEKT
jgi:integrase